MLYNLHMQIYYVYKNTCIDEVMCTSRKVNLTVGKSSFMASYKKKSEIMLGVGIFNNHHFIIGNFTYTTGFFRKNSGLMRIKIWILGIWDPIANRRFGFTQIIFSGSVMSKLVEWSPNMVGWTRIWPVWPNAD